MPAKHTPGPLIFKFGDIFAENGNGETIARIVKGKEADGFLFAAAPDMLEALEMAKEFISERLQAEERQSRPAAWLVNDLRGKIFTINAALAKAKSKGQP